MCKGQGLDSKGWRSCKKEVNNKEEKEEAWKRGFFLFHFIGHPFVLFSDSVVPLLLGPSFPSLSITSYLYNLQHLPSRPCPRHMM